MEATDTWLRDRGPAVAAMLESRREALCEIVTSQFAAMFPSLCYDPTRFHAEAFQQQVFNSTPSRFLNMILVSLQFSSTSMFEQQCAWTWQIAPRYGIMPAHMLMMTRMFFDTIHDVITLDTTDEQGMREFEQMIVQIIERITMPNIKPAPCRMDLWRRPTT